MLLQRHILIRKTNMTQTQHPLPLYRLTLVALALFCLAGSQSLRAQCASPCTRQGSSFASDQAKLGISFNAASQARTADGRYAFAEIELAAHSSTETQYLTATGFGFNIPDGAVITQISVEIQKRASAIGTETAVRDSEVRLIKQGTISGNNTAAPITWSIRDFAESYAGGLDFWGVELSGKDINDPGFGVALSAQLTSGGAPIRLSAQVDRISVTVEYTVPVPLTISEFTTVLQSATVACKWVLEKEEAGTRMILQQSTDQKTWKDLRAYNLASNVTHTPYRHSDQLSATGTYYYRVKMIAQDNTITYSKVSSVRYGEDDLKLYPTSAQSMVYLENVDPKARIEVYDLNSRLMPVSTVAVKDRMLAVRVSHLPKGLYIIRVGRETRKFVKE